METSSGSVPDAAPPLAASDAEHYYFWRVNTDKEAASQTLVLDTRHLPGANGTVTVEEVSAARAGEPVPDAARHGESGMIRLAPQPPQSVWLITISRSVSLKQ